jgi:ATP-dependent DNA helicase RecG
MAARVSIEQLTLLPSDARLELLLERPEGQWLERVSARIQARDVGDLMIGFANAEGGLLAIGLHDGRVEGVSRSPRRVNDWRQAAQDFSVPPVRHRVVELACTNERGEADAIVVIEIDPSDRVHENVRGQSFLRVGDENRRLGPLEVQELHFDKGDSTFDGQPLPGGASGNPDTALVERYREALRATSEAEVVLRARGLATADSGDLTVAGTLVLGRDPQGHFPEAHVRLLRYSGSSRETGVRGNILADVRVEGPLPAQIEAAREHLREWIPTAVRLGESGRFDSTPLIPEFAWLEAVVNAVTHRSYSFGGDHVRVELFDDRLEVTSPGRLPGLVRLDNIRTTRFARNPRIARALSDLGYGRELGEGVNRMFEEMSRVGLPDPVYAEGPAWVRVTLLTDPLGRRLLDELPLGSARFVEHLSRTGRVTTTEAVQLLSMSRPTVLKHLHHLAERGLIQHTGTSLKDPRGFWRLVRGAPRG